MKKGPSVLAAAVWAAALGAAPGFGDDPVTGAGPGTGVGPVVGAAYRPSVCVLSLGAEGMEIDASFRGGSEDEVGFLLDIEGEGATLRSRMRLGGVSGRPLFLAGPGEASGPLRFLTSPVSTAEVFGGGEAARLDRSMDSGTGIALLQGDLFFAFAALRGGGASAGANAGARPWTLCSLPALGGEPGLTEGAARADATGAFGLRSQLGGGALAVIVSANAREALPASGGWLPDRAADPGGLSWRGSLSFSRVAPGAKGAFGLALSAGERDAPGLALRAEAESKSGQVGISAIAGAASTDFRDLFGRKSASAIALGARFAARLPTIICARACASAGASMSTRAEVSGSIGAKGIVAAQAIPRLRWERRTSVGIDWSVGEAYRLKASAGLADRVGDRVGDSVASPSDLAVEPGDFDMAAGGLDMAAGSQGGDEPIVRLELGIDRKLERGAFSHFQSCGLRAVLPLGTGATRSAGGYGAELGLDLRSRLSLGRSGATGIDGLEPATPAVFEAELGLEYDAEGQTRALASARLELPATEGASFELTLKLPEEGAVLGIAESEGKREGPSLSFVYRAELSPGISP
ncbi:MAG: hypothetical protein Q8M76_10245 [Spirochaetaceae bacterium]|nr:hypothetical protein [Spirochaetaceae bacterium]